MLSQLAVPLRRKGKVIGALNLLNEAEGAFTPQHEALLRQFAAHVAVAIENARLFKSERHYVDTLETLAEIGREMSSILDLDALYAEHEDVLIPDSLVSSSRLTERATPYWFTAARKKLSLTAGQTVDIGFVNVVLKGD